MEGSKTYLYNVLRIPRFTYCEIHVAPEIFTINFYYTILKLRFFVQRVTCFEILIEKTSVSIENILSNRNFWPAELDQPDTTHYTSNEQTARIPAAESRRGFN